eukprot:7757056-Alexandrium_andersonii.AAC.1
MRPAGGTGNAQSGPSAYISGDRACPRGPNSGALDTGDGPGASQGCRAPGWRRLRWVATIWPASRP